MIDFNKWVDRIDNELSVQKELCLETVRITFTRNELVELKIALNTLIDLENQKKGGGVMQEVFENIIEQLEESKHNALIMVGYEKAHDDVGERLKAEGEANAYKYAIEIVKGGGVNE